MIRNPILIYINIIIGILIEIWSVFLKTFPSACSFPVSFFFLIILSKDPYSHIFMVVFPPAPSVSDSAFPIFFPRITLWFFIGGLLSFIFFPPHKENYVFFYNITLWFFGGVDVSPPMACHGVPGAVCLGFSVCRTRRLTQEIVNLSWFGPSIVDRVIALRLVWR